LAVTDGDVRPVCHLGGEEAGEENGLAGTGELIAKVEAHPVVNTRLRLTHVDDGWQVRFGDVLLGVDDPADERIWSDPTDVFFAGRLPGQVVAELIRERSQSIGDLKVTAPAPQNNGNYTRLRGQRLWNHSALPWPRTVWLVGPAQTPATSNQPILIGTGPSFLDANAAFWAFFHGIAPNANASRPTALWQVVLHDHRAWLHRVTITPDALTVLVKGTHLDGVRVELTTPTRHLVRPVGRTRRVRLRLPRGLAPDTLLMLRTDNDWLDYRHFPPAATGGHGDQSVVFELPGARVSRLIAGGETDVVEFRREVPEGDSRKLPAGTV
jgi:hypothetical protein